MNNIIVFAGTTEGKEISEALQYSNIEHYVSVATEYGRETFCSELKKPEYVHVISGRLNENDMKTFFSHRGINLIVDATHPYALEVSKTIRSAAGNLGIKVIRVKRESEFHANSFHSNKELIDALVKVDGNILLTTGSKTLDQYAEREELKGRLYVRVIPGIESFEKCRECGIEPDHIIGMQGPFSEEMNLALINNYNVKAMVTKNSGKAGGFEEKLSAAEKSGIKFFCLERPDEKDAISIDDAINEISIWVGKSIKSLKTSKTKVSIIGVGMGSRMIMTNEAENCIEEAHVFIGASRMLSFIEICNKSNSYNLYKPQDICKCILDNKGSNIVVLMSGDSGFYSGSSKLIKMLDEIGDNEISVEVMPGISSVSYMASRLCESYEDAYICSIHGKLFEDVKAELWQQVNTHTKSFILVSGYEDVLSIYELFKDKEIIAGLLMSSSQEKIIKINSETIKELIGEKIITLFVKNSNPCKKVIFSELTDDKLLREKKIPMTKKEIRDICISKLGIRSGDVVWDIGSGTGSVAVAIASLSPDIKVVAFEKNQNACSLIHENAIRNNIYNVDIINCTAPEYPDNMKYMIPDRVFIGGSSGNINNIIADVFERNSKAVIVATAVTLETVLLFSSIHNDDYGVKSEIIEVQINRSNQVGKYHMMKSENPVYICKLWKG